MQLQLGKGLAMLATIACFGAIASASVHAQKNSVQVSPPPGAHATSRDMRATEILGKKVRHPQGEELGEIESLIVDIDNGRVRYAVMSFNGFVDVGDKLFTFPIGTFGVDQQQRLALNVDREQLEKAPGFEPDRRPNFSDETYRTAVDRFFFKEEIVRYTPSGARLVEARDLIGKEVNDRAATNAGEIQDLVVNLGTGRAYALMEVDEAWSLRSKLVAMPFMGFMVPDRPDLDLILNVDRPKVEQARNLEGGEWPDLNAPAVQRLVTNQLSAFREQSASNPSATQTERTSSGASQ
jgi:sporulation protein YlmC with PRC-barrel domain